MRLAVAVVFVAWLSSACNDSVGAAGDTSVSEIGPEVAVEIASDSEVAVEIASDSEVEGEAEIASDTEVDPGDLPTPGDDIVFSGTLPAGYGTTPPNGTSGACASGAWWRRGSLEGSPDMTPGAACTDCHQRNEGPALHFAGTVFANATDVDDCLGVGGVTIEILGPDGTVAATETSRASGNFYMHALAPAITTYTARLTYQGRTREMVEPLSSDDDDCNVCHTATGGQGALGRIVAP